MKYIKLYEELFNNDEFKHYCELYNIQNYTINSDNTIDVNGDVDFSTNKDLEILPIKFKNVYGNFKCFDMDLNSIWNDDGTFNKNRFKLLMDELVHNK